MYRLGRNACNGGQKTGACGLEVAPGWASERQSLEGIFVIMMKSCDIGLFAILIYAFYLLSCSWDIILDTIATLNCCCIQKTWRVAFPRFWWMTIRVSHLAPIFLFEGSKFWVEIFPTWFIGWSGHSKFAISQAGQKRQKETKGTTVLILATVG